VLDGRKVLGERENLTPGLSGDFSITLKPGTYTTLCPNGKTAAEGELVVTGGASTEPEPAQSAASQAAVGAYGEYVESDATKLVADTTSRAFPASSSSPRKSPTARSSC
jgi:iron uptake system component EfeO